MKIVMTVGALLFFISLPIYGQWEYSRNIDLMTDVDTSEATLQSSFIRGNDGIHRRRGEFLRVQCLPSGTARVFLRLGGQVTVSSSYSVIYRADGGPIRSFGSWTHKHVPVCFRDPCRRSTPELKPLVSSALALAQIMKSSELIIRLEDQPNASTAVFRVNKGRDQLMRLSCLP